MLRMSVELHPVLPVLSKKIRHKLYYLQLVPFYLRFVVISEFCHSALVMNPELMIFEIRAISLEP